jgi:hypothetical protein
MSAESRTPPLAVAALILACLVILPLAPLVGAILGMVALLRSPQGAKRGAAIAAIAVGASVTLVVQATCGVVALGVLTAGAHMSRDIEARANLTVLTSQISKYIATAEKRLPPTGDWTPSKLACDRHGRAQPAQPEAWKAPPWINVGFSIPKPHHLQYRIAAVDAEHVSAEARADPKCDGHYLVYHRTVGRDGTVGRLLSDLQ